jgi:hypothetical protein
MAFLDWMKQRGQRAPETVPRREVLGDLFAEWRQDYRLAKLRDESGKEPESEPLDNERPKESPEKKTPPTRVRVKSRDIPF